MWVILRSSTAHKLDYWLTLVYPSLVADAAARMDRLQHGVLEKLLGLAIPLQEDALRQPPLGYDCPLDVPVDSLRGRSFQSLVTSQPVKMGGLGLRSNLETSLPAFIGGLELALPHLVGADGVCQALSDVIGDGSLPPTQCWQTLLESQCRTGQELARAWQ